MSGWGGKEKDYGRLRRALGGERVDALVNEVKN